MHRTDNWVSSKQTYDENGPDLSISNKSPKRLSRGAQECQGTDGEFRKTTCGLTGLTLRVNGELVSKTMGEMNDEHILRQKKRVQSYVVNVQ